MRSLRCLSRFRGARAASHGNHGGCAVVSSGARLFAQRGGARGSSSTTTEPGADVCLYINDYDDENGSNMCKASGPAGMSSSEKTNRKSGIGVERCLRRVTN